jgi:zinc and cadmium transporter
MIWTYTIISVMIVSLISLIGVFTLSVRRETLEKLLIYLVSLSTGTLLGDAFIHLIPEAYKNDNSVYPALYILSGVLTFFILEKYLHWRHCHHIASSEHPHPFSYVILIGDAVHNFIDGLIIAGSYLVSIPIGLATTIAVVFHEIPHEIGNFGSLIYGGFARAKALKFNFLTALTAIAGAVIVLLINFDTVNIARFLIPFAAGGFIYVASADLIPELHKDTNPKKSFWQLTTFILGIALMFTLLLFE